MGQQNMDVNRDILAVQVCCSLTSCLHTVFTMPCEHKIPVYSRFVGVHQDSKQIQDQCVTFMIEQRHCQP
jgi:hypothetical protein